MKKKGNPRKNEQSHVAKATLRQVRISPRKAKLLVDLVRGMPVERALHVLTHTPKKASPLVAGVIRSAISNAKEKNNADVDKLWISGGWVEMGQTMQRWMPSAHGRATPIRKRASHITILLDER